MSEYEITGMETYETTGDEVHTDDDGFSYMIDPANGDRLYLMQDAESEAPAEYFPDQFTPDAAVATLGTMPLEAREEFLTKNRPPVIDGGSGSETTRIRHQWQAARMELLDTDNPNKNEEFARYLRMLGGDNHS